MWVKICNTYERDTEQQRCKLLQQFYSVSFSKNMDMSAYISKVKNLAFRLNAIKTNIDDKMIISKLLTTLSKEYSHFISAWESTETQKKTLDNLVARLLGEEQRYHPKEAVAFKVFHKKCNVCNKTGYLGKFCKFKETQKDKKQVHCFKCNKVRHPVKFCKEENTNENRCNICKKKQS